MVLKIYLVSCTWLGSLFLFCRHWLGPCCSNLENDYYEMLSAVLPSRATLELYPVKTGGNWFMFVDQKEYITPVLRSPHWQPVCFQKQLVLML